jgi:hypothetical protein
MYIGQCSITRLNMLLVGYSQARMELGLPRTEQEKNFDNFQEWIQSKFNIKSSQSWDSIILSNSTDEKDAFYKFFQLFEQFLHGVTNTANLELTTKSTPDYSNI